MQQNAPRLAARFAGRISLQDAEHVSLRLAFLSFFFFFFLSLLQRPLDRNIPRSIIPSS